MAKQIIVLETTPKGRLRAPSLVAGLAAHPMRGGGAAANPMWGYA